MQDTINVVLLVCYNGGSSKEPCTLTSHATIAIIDDFGCTLTRRTSRYRWGTVLFQLLFTFGIE